MPEADEDNEGGGESGGPTDQFDDGTAGVLAERFDDQEDDEKEEVEDDDVDASTGETTDTAGDSEQEEGPADTEEMDESSGKPGAGDSATGSSDLGGSGQMQSEALLAAAMAMEEPEVDAIRERPQVPAYLPEPLAEAITKRFQEFNARRTLRGEDPVQKEVGFMEGVWRFVLSEMSDEELEEYLPPYAGEDD